jgi:hypothetical protein
MPHERGQLPVPPSEFSITLSPIPKLVSAAPANRSPPFLAKPADLTATHLR